MQAERLTGRARAMNEQQRFTQAQLTRSIWSVSHRIAELQRQLATAVAEKDRLVRHLEQLEKEEARLD